MKVLRAIKSFALNYAKWVESSYRKARDALREKDYEHFALNALAVAALTVAIPLAALWLIVFLWRTVLIYVLTFIAVLSGIAIALIINNFDEVSKRVKAWLTKVDGDDYTKMILWGVLQDLIADLEPQMKIMAVTSLPNRGSWHREGRTLYCRFMIIKLPHHQTQNLPEVCQSLRAHMNQRRYVIYQSTAYATPFTHPDSFYIMSLKDNGKEYVLDVIPINEDNKNSQQISQNQYALDNAPQGFVAESSAKTSCDVADVDF
jgi:hypothetical protein